MSQVLRMTLIGLAGLWVAIGSAAADRVGDDTCLACHDQVARPLSGTPHRSDRGVSCEDCHGDGGDHADSPSVDNIRRFVGAAADDSARVCRACHLRHQPGQSSHDSLAAGCLACHTAWHGPDTQGIAPARLLKSRPAAACVSCHSVAGADFRKPYRHRVATFANVCVSCHDPHRSARELRGRGVERRCAGCHPEAAGPFVYTHLGTKSGQSCLECHLPHGSTNPHLLNRHEARFICLSCHSSVPLSHDQSDPRYRRCTACHTAVHGSNRSRKLLR